ncbi:carbon-phosphorus lyase [Paenibacillus sp. HJL G12]|uniref:Carbon-phosphorus lyase n=1 Tax=Paenibacillus dendrobii TaxID=2691084 RepID=A0A7X3LFY4_9BACL|nr:MBL fold metallo-hydrolase [Paenibacillus dendrobii]MWV42665.1 carbon-phosphorus lyase [Paenibacillus dendrobii]
MKIHFLGTAAAEGFPNPFCRCEACRKARSLGEKNIRTRSSILIDDVIKVDYSADSHMQALRDRIDLGAVEHLLFTHTHYDHFQPSDLYNRIEGFAHGIDHPLHIYGNDAAICQSGMALGQVAGSNRFAFHLLRPFETISLGNTKITPLLANHDQLETCLLFYIEKGGKTLFYGNDTGWLHDDTWAWLKGKVIDMAILDCTHSFTNNVRNPNHMGIETVLEVQRIWKEEGILDGNGLIYVTHFTHNSGFLHDDFESAFRPFGIQVAYDGLIVDL